MLFLFCIALIFAAPVIHVVCSMLQIKNRVKLPLAAIGVICMVLGVILSVLATYIDMVNLPAGVKCATPSLGFAFLGISITLTAIPVTAIIFYIISYYRNKRIMTT